MLLSQHYQNKSKGNVLFEMVVKKLQLLESDYFDLQYINIEGMLVCERFLSIYALINKTMTQNT